MFWPNRPEPALHDLAIHGAITLWEAMIDEFRTYPPEDGALECCEAFRKFYDYLLANAGAGRFPGRQHFDPIDLSQILPAINLVDLVGNDQDYRLRYRLVGSLQAHYFAGDRNVVGHYLDTFWQSNPELKPHILGDYQRAVERRGPTIGQYERPNADFPFLNYARMVFPLATDGSRIDMFFVLHAYRDPMTNELVCHL